MASSAISQAVAFLVYDRIGLLIEQTLKLKQQNRLTELPRGTCLTRAELRSAAKQHLPSAKRIGRDSSVHAMMMSTSAHVGKTLSHSKVSKGLRYVGDPWCWPASARALDNSIIIPIHHSGGQQQSANGVQTTTGTSNKGSEVLHGGGMSAVPSGMEQITLDAILAQANKLYCAAYSDL